VFLHSGYQRDECNSILVSLFFAFLPLSHRLLRPVSTSTIAKYIARWSGHVGTHIAFTISVLFPVVQLMLKCDMGHICSAG
jgi:hypothetical protein